jgi:hypothetical protein
VVDIGLSVADAAILMEQKVVSAALALATTGSTDFSGDVGVVHLERPAFKRHDPCRITKHGTRKQMSDFSLMTAEEQEEMEERRAMLRGCWNRRIGRRGRRRRGEAG